MEAAVQDDGALDEVAAAHVRIAAEQKAQAWLPILDELWSTVAAQGGIENNDVDGMALQILDQLSQLAPTVPRPVMFDAVRDWLNRRGDQPTSHALSMVLTEKLDLNWVRDQARDSHRRQLEVLLHGVQGLKELRRTADNPRNGDWVPVIGGARDRRFHVGVVLAPQMKLVQNLHRPEDVTEVPLSEIPSAAAASSVLPRDYPRTPWVRTTHAAHALLDRLYKAGQPSPAPPRSAPPVADGSCDLGAGITSWDFLEADDVLQVPTGTMLRLSFRAAFHTEGAVVSVQAGRAVTGEKRMVVGLKHTAGYEATYDILKPGWSVQVARGEHSGCADVDTGELPWPRCIMEHVRLSGHNYAAYFSNLGSRGGCYNDNCTFSDRFANDNVAECARACHAAEGCAAWTWGDFHGVGTCWLRAAALPGDRVGERGFASGVKACVPQSHYELRTALKTALEEEEYAIQAMKHAAAEKRRFAALAADARDRVTEAVARARSAEGGNQILRSLGASTDVEPTIEQIARTVWNKRGREHVDAWEVLVEVGHVTVDELENMPDSQLRTTARKLVHHPRFQYGG